MTGPWEYAVSKTRLTRAPWPALRTKIGRCRADASAPVSEIVAVVRDAYRLAQRWRYRAFLISDDPSAGHIPGNGKPGAPG
jgi:hypothetical protein